MDHPDIRYFNTYTFLGTDLGSRQLRMARIFANMDDGIEQVTQKAEAFFERVDQDLPVLVYRGSVVVEEVFEHYMSSLDDTAMIHLATKPPRPPKIEEEADDPGEPIAEGQLELEANSESTTEEAQDAGPSDAVGNNP